MPVKQQLALWTVSSFHGGFKSFVCVCLIAREKERERERDRERDSHVVNKLLKEQQQRAYCERRLNFTRPLFLNRVVIITRPIGRVPEGVTTSTAATLWQTVRWSGAGGGASPLSALDRPV